MTLLQLEGVHRRHGSPPHERVALNDVNFELHGGELVVVWGRRRSGRSSMLRVAAGIEPPDSGNVRFQGRDIHARGGEALGHGIGYCKRSVPPGAGRSVLEKLTVGLRMRGASRSHAAARVHAALERSGASDCAGLGFAELDDAEAARVSIARALVLEPAVLLIDEPVAGVDSEQRDSILELLRSLADEGIAVLMTVGETTGLAGNTRAMTINAGVLRGELQPELASVHPLRGEATA